MELRKLNGVTVVPIILSHCAWQDDKDISKILAIPDDGKPIISFVNQDEGWLQVYKDLRKVVLDELKIRNIKINDEFKKSLNNIELLTKAHPQKEFVTLEDIFVYPDMDKFDDIREFDKKESSEKLIRDFVKYSKVLISGENQSGKTTLCKKIFVELKDQNFVPVYINDHKNLYKGKIKNIIENSYYEQYFDLPISEIDKRRIVPILDDFHFATEKEKHLRDLNEYEHQIIIVDDIFGLNAQNEHLIYSYTHFRLIEFGASLRNKLIKKWASLYDTLKPNNGIDHYWVIDNTTEVVNDSLGKIIGSGIMPSYPFFILSIISTYEAFDKPLNQEITSQGYCYQALIFMYLRKQGVKSDEVDTYVNFLTELFFFFFNTKIKEMSSLDLENFLFSYSEKFNLPIKPKTLIDTLVKTQILHLDSFNNVSICYPYIYYFFVAKYIAEHLDDKKVGLIINSILKNLHNDENAYIAVFVSHHSINSALLDEIVENAMSLFPNCKPATLKDDETDFFNDKLDVVVEEVLPLGGFEDERNRRLEQQDLIETNGTHAVHDSDCSANDIASELRRTIKTVEVMGRIIKNRAGSLEKSKLEFIFEEAMTVHLRTLSSFFNLIKNDSDQKGVIDYLSMRIKTITDHKNEERKKENQPMRDLSKEDIEKLAKKIFWNLNIAIVYGLFNKIVHSLGSDKLKTIAIKVCDNINTPASFLVKHGILMWYCKNLQVDTIGTYLEKKHVSEIATKVMKFMIVNHCSMHPIGYKDRQRIQHHFKIPSQAMIVQGAIGKE